MLGRLFFSLFTQINKENSVVLCTSMLPSDVIIYNPLFHNSNQLYFIKCSDKEVEVIQGFEMSEIIQRVDMNQDIDKILFQIIISIPALRMGLQKYNQSPRTIIALDHKYPSLIVDILKMLPYLNSPTIKDIFKDNLTLQEVPLALCIIRLMKLAFEFCTSDSTGVYRSQDEQVNHEKTFYKWMYKVENRHQRFIIMGMAVSKNMHELFGRKIGDEVSKLYHNANLIPDIVETTKLVFGIKSDSTTNKGGINFVEECLENIQVTNNKLFINYLKNGDLSLGQVMVSDLTGLAYADVAFEYPNTKIAHFMQWTLEPYKATSQNRERCNHILFSGINQTPLRFELLMEKVQNIRIPDKFLEINGTKKKSTIGKRRLDKIKEVFRNMDMKTFYKAELAFSRIIFLNLDCDSINFDRDIKDMFSKNVAEQKYIYSRLLDYNIFSLKNDGNIFSLNNEGGNKKEEEIDHNIFKSHLLRKLRYCRYEDFYALLVVELFKTVEEKMTDFIGNMKREVPTSRCRKYQSTRYAEKSMEDWWKYKATDVYTSESFKLRMVSLMSSVRERELELGGINNLLVKKFKKKNDSDIWESFDELRKMEEYDLFKRECN